MSCHRTKHQLFVLMLSVVFPVKEVYLLFFFCTIHCLSHDLALIQLAPVHNYEDGP